MYYKFIIICILTLYWIATINIVIITKNMFRYFTYSKVIKLNCINMFTIKYNVQCIIIV